MVLVTLDVKLILPVILPVILMPLVMVLVTLLAMLIVPLHSKTLVNQKVLLVSLVNSLGFPVTLPWNKACLVAALTRLESTLKSTMIFRLA
jgi:hypothetical protein